MTPMLIARFVHFLGFSAWLGGLLAAGLLLRAGASAKLAAMIADNGATLVILSGIYTAVKGAAFSHPWLHIKLTLVAALLGVHVAMRLKVKRADGRSAGSMVLVVGVLAALILFTVVFRPFSNP
jgi:uncharacterized membrane protein